MLKLQRHNSVFILFHAENIIKAIQFPYKYYFLHMFQKLAVNFCQMG